MWRGVSQTRVGCAFHPWYQPATGRYSRVDPLGRRGGRNLYGYAEANPVKCSDLLGLTVYKCCAPADILFGIVDQCWLKTDTREAGLGNLDEGQPSGEAIPGGQCDLPYITLTQVVDHTGASTSRKGAFCEEVPDADEECVNREIWTDSRGYGPTAGSFTLGNNCQTWADGVLDDCRKRCLPASPVPPGLPSFKGFF